MFEVWFHRKPLARSVSEPPCLTWLSLCPQGGGRAIRRLPYFCLILCARGCVCVCVCVWVPIPGWNSPTYIIYLEGESEGEIQNVHRGFLLSSICMTQNLLEVWFFSPQLPRDLWPPKLQGCLCFYVVLFYTKEECHLNLCLFFSQRQ